MFEKTILQHRFFFALLLPAEPRSIRYSRPSNDVCQTSSGDALSEAAASCSEDRRIATLRPGAPTAPTRTGSSAKSDSMLRPKPE